MKKFYYAFAVMVMLGGLCTAGSAATLSADHTVIATAVAPAGAADVMLNRANRTINGTVKNESGEALPGVSIFVKGTTLGTVTDVDGNYKLDIPGDSATLVFTYVGYIPEEVVAGANSQIDMTLYPDISTLSEIVVVGYGTTQRRDLTGAVASVDLKDKSLAPNTNIGQALQGAVPGVNVGLSPTPGGTPSITIRGQTSLSGSDNPLIVLDGIIFNGNLADINMNDIQSIDVLKDASAAAVYGSRSANGVLLITTKAGTSEKPRFNVNMYTGFQDLSPTDATKVMNGEQYMTRLVDYAYQSQALLAWYKTNPKDASTRPVRPDPTDPAVVAGVVHSTEEYNNWRAGNETHWMDEVLRSSAGIQNVDLSMSGKTAKTSYYLSGAHVKQDGIRVGDDFKRTSLRANFSNDITSWLTAGLNISYSVSDYSGVAADVSEALQSSPWANKMNANGNYTIDLAGESSQRNPLSNTVANDENIRNDLFLVGRAVVKVPWVKGLSYEFNFSHTQVYTHQYDFYPATTLDGSQNNGYGFRQHQDNKSRLFNNIVTYSRMFSDHKIDVTLLATRERRIFDTSLLQGYNFDIPSLGYNDMSLANIQRINSTAEEENNLGYMGRVSYGYKNRYLLTGTVRRDGFSGFAAGNKTAVFKSGSLGWVISEEDFLGDPEWLSFLKLRVSYGENGNQDVGRFASIAQAQTLFAVFDGDTYVGYRPSSLGNSQLTWETTASVNLGLDFTVWRDRISGSIDVYNAKTKDVLVQRNLPKATGFTSVLENVGEINNKGIEIGINTTNVNNGSFRWETGVNFSMNRNKLVKLFGGANDYDIGNSWFTGQPINSYYGYHNLGTVYTEDEFFRGEVPSGFYPGHFKIEDIATPDGHAKYDANDDRRVLGSSDPNYRFSISNKLSYKNFSLSFLVNSIQGGGGYYLGDPGNLIAGGTDAAIRENRTAIRPYWRPDAPTTNSPGIYYTQPVSGTLFIKRSFVRLQDVTLAYTLPSSILGKIGIDAFRIYVSGKNVATWTNWTGWDPEVTDQTPVMRSFVVGLNTTF